MKIGVDIRPLQEKMKSGVGEFTYELLAALFRIDKINEYFIFSNARNLPAPLPPRTDGVKVKHVHKEYSNKILNFRFSFLNSPKIDKIIGEKLDAFILPNINFCALSPGIKKILVVHDLSFDIFPEFFSGKGRLWHRMVKPKNLCHEADKIVAVSQNTKKDIIDRYDVSPEKISVIYPGVPERLSVPANEAQKQAAKQKYNLPDRFILYLGNIEPRKNISGLIAAYNNLKRKKTIDHALVIGGASIFSGNGKTRPENGVNYIGYVADEERPALYALADAFVFPSYYEGFGFPPLEAITQGTPVIASNAGSLPEILEDAAVLVNPYSQSELEAAIGEVLGRPELSSILREKGRRLLQRYNWEKSARDWLAILDSLKNSPADGQIFTIKKPTAYPPYDAGNQFGPNRT